jgi:hypothetical protein
MAALDAIFKEISDAYKSGALKVDPANTSLSNVSGTSFERTPEQKAAESAKYLKEDLPTSKVGNPTWNYWDGQGKYANITGVDGKEYMFVPDDYVRKGAVSGDIQFYNKQFLDPATFKNAVQYTLPKGMQSVINNNGYVWSIDDYNNLGLQNSNGYKIDADNPAILGLGNPHPSMQVGSPISYITQPKLAPGGERVQQDWITAADGRMGGLGQYSYYRYQGPFADMARGALKELGPLTPILLDVFAGPGTGAIYTMSKAAGEASYTGDWNKAATTIGTVLAAPYVAGAVSGALGGVLDLGTVANSVVGNAAGNAVVAGLTGADPVSAFINSGIGGAVGTIMGKIDGFSELPPSVQKVFNATLRAELTGKDPTQAALLAATTSGLQAIKNGMDANAKFQSNYGRDATPEELNNFAYVQNQDELNSSFEKYMANVGAQQSAQQAVIDEQNRKDAEAAAQKAAIDEQNKLDAQAKIDAETKAAADAQAKAQADAQAAIDAEVAAQAKAQEDAQAAIDAETERAAQEAKEAEEQAKRVADFGKDLPGGGVQDLGPVDTDTDFYDENSSGKGAYKYDPETGNYTFTSDDGSTITIDENTNIVGVTEATDTPWTGITDAKTGNLNLPTLPSGKTPNVNINTMKTPNPGLPALSPLVAAGMFGALMQNQGSGYNPAPVQAPNVTMDWNPQPVQAPENGIAYGQQFLNPTYSTGAAGGGLMSLAAGGMTGKFTTLGSYSDGGRLLRGPGDGMSDNIPATIANRQPARLADGEFVVPADVVSHLGNGSTDAGAKVLYAMMDRVRKARTGKAKQGKKIQPQKFVPI